MVSNKNEENTVMRSEERERKRSRDACFLQTCLARFRTKGKLWDVKSDRVPSFACETSELESFLRRILFQVRAENSYFAADFRLKKYSYDYPFLFSNVFGRHGWFYVNQFNANLRTTKLDMTRITSSRNVISIEHAASAVFCISFTFTANNCIYNFSA